MESVCLSCGRMDSNLFSDSKGIAPKWKSKLASLMPVRFLKFTTTL